ncbi:MAG: MucB/RseB C-terminal domain-containing protein [Pseudomonadota bacterium]
MRAVQCYWLLLITVFSGSAFAENNTHNAMEWLDRMISAQQKLNYHGTFVYFHDGNLESMKVFHASGEAGERERLIHLNGTAREVVRNNDIVTCIFPNDKLVVVDKRHGRRGFSPLLSTKNIAAFEQNYRLQLSEKTDRVAGQMARLIEVEPKDAFRYGYRLWVNDQGLLLRADLVDENKKLIEQIMFTELTVVNDIPHDVLIPSIDLTGFVWYRQDQIVDMANNQSEAGWKVGVLPRGFALKLYHQRKPEKAGENMLEHLVITDGLASISVFIEPTPADAKQEIKTFQMGALNVHTTFKGEYQVTVLGDVPSATVQKIAQSVTRVSRK